MKRSRAGYLTFAVGTLLNYFREVRFAHAGRIRSVLEATT